MKLYGDSKFFCILKRSQNDEIYPTLKFYDKETNKFINAVTGTISELENIINVLLRGGWQLELENHEQSIHHAIVRLTGKWVKLWVKTQRTITRWLILAT